MGVVVFTYDAWVLQPFHGYKEKQKDSGTYLGTDDITEQLNLPTVEPFPSIM